MIGRGVCGGVVNGEELTRFIFIFLIIIIFLKASWLHCFLETINTELNVFIYLFIFGWVGSSFLCEGFLQLRQAGAALHRDARASHYRGLSCCGAQAPDAQAQ